MEKTLAEKIENIDSKAILNNFLGEATEEDKKKAQEARDLLKEAREKYGNIKFESQTAKSDPKEQ